MAIWRGNTISALRLFPFRSEIDTQKCSETMSKISSGVTSLRLSEEMISFKASLLQRAISENRCVQFIKSNQFIKETLPEFSDICLNVRCDIFGVHHLNIVLFQMIQLDLLL